LGAAAMGPVEAGTAKAIALLTGEPSPLFPRLKTSKDQGIGGVDSYFWTAFLFPKGTPDPIVQKLHKAFTQVLSSQQTTERLQKAGASPIRADQRTPEYLTKFLPSELAKWSAMVKASGVTIE
jgi:tripartite-type tricarboxylate transporter receptor subunit TctC